MVHEAGAAVLEGQARGRVDSECWAGGRRRRIGGGVRRWRRRVRQREAAPRWSPSGGPRNCQSLLETLVWKHTFFNLPSPGMIEPDAELTAVQNHSTTNSRSRPSLPCTKIWQLSVSGPGWSLSSSMCSSTLFVYIFLPTMAGHGSQRHARSFYLCNGDSF